MGASRERPIVTRGLLGLALGLAAGVGVLVGVVVSRASAPDTPRESTGRQAAPSSLTIHRTVRAAPADTAVERSSTSPVSAPPADTRAALALPSFADVAEQLNPAVVSVDATFPAERRRGTVPPLEPGDESPRRGRPDPDRVRRGAGAGVLIDPEGHVLTNHHVVDRADRITVNLLDGARLPARVVGTDPETDIALLKVEASGPLPYARLGDSDTLRVGDWVVAIGNPLSYDHTLTVGVVSFLGRRLADSSLDRYIQTDAAITFGNSGGPLINTRGDVVGINTALSARASSIGFAVPINDAVAILPQLKERGSVARGYAGLMLRSLDPDLQAWLGLPSGHGAVVQDVTVGSPGGRAGVKPYDAIVSVDGRPIADHHALISTIASRDPGTTAVLGIVREGHTVSVPIKLATRPSLASGSVDRGPSRTETPGETVRRPAGLGLSVRELDGPAALRLGLKRGESGLFVSRVDANGSAATTDLARGDVILEIDRQPVRIATDLTRLTRDRRAGDVVALYVYRPARDERLLYTIRLD